jgi:peptide/nickel transport system permease protein
LIQLTASPIKQAVSRFVFHRLLVTLPVLIIVSVISFGIIWLMPGDAASAFLEPGATPEQVDRVRQTLGLDKPFYLQVLAWYGRILQGDLGQSILLHRGVADAILERLPVTVSLAGVALILATLAGIAAGTLAALWRDRSPDQLLMGVAVLGISVPEFWLGLLLIVIFGVDLGWFPTGGYVPLTQSIGGWARSISLPAIALAAGSVGFIARMTRSAMLEVLSQDYVRTAEAEGLPRAVVILRHGLPNALIPILTVIGILTGGLLGGAVVIEQVFSLPGVGRLLIGAILSRDMPVIQGGLLLIAVIYLAVNLLIDVVYVVADPRIRVN